MAKSIKGITIEIGGDTTKLGKALSEVNKDTKSLQYELNSVDKLLKLDPTNTELLTQKQDILKEAILKTKEKLDVLATSQKSLSQQLADGDIDQQQYDKFQEKLEKSKSKLEELKQEQSKVEEQYQNGEIDKNAYDNFQKKVLSAENQVKSLESTQKTLEERLADGDIDEGQYRAFQREVVSAQNELSSFENQLAQTESTISNANSQLIDTTSTLKEVNTQLEDTGSRFDWLGENSTEFNSKMSQALTDVIDKVVDLGKQAVDMSEQFNDAYDIIIKKTGATGESLEQFKESANNVYSQIPTTLIDSATAVGEVNTKFALTGEQLEDVSKMFIEFATINDTDVNNSIDTVSQLMKQWGLNMEDLSGLLGLITSNAQATGISVDSLISGVFQNAGTFKELDYSIEEAINQMGRFEVTGVNSTTALAGFKKAVTSTNESLNDNGSIVEVQKNIANYTKENQNYSEKIQDLQDKIEVLKAKQLEYTETTKESTKLADSQKLVDYQQDIEKYTQSIADNKQNIELLNQSLEDTGSKSISIRQSLEETFESIKNASTESEALSIGTDLFGSRGATEMVSAIRDGRMELDDLYSNMNEYTSLVSDTYNATISPIEQLTTTTNKLKVATAEIGTEIVEEVNPIVQNGVAYVEENLPQIKELISNIVTALGNSLNNALPIVIAVANKISQFVSFLCDNSDVVIATLSGIGVGLLAFNVVSMIQGVVTAIKMFQVANEGATVSQALLNVVMSANPLGLIVMAIAGVVTALAVFIGSNEEAQEKLKSIWESIKNFFIGIGSNIKNFFSKTITGIVTWFTELPTKIYNAIIVTVAKISAWGTDMYNTARSSVSNVVHGIVTWFSEIPNNIKTIGNNIVTGLWNGIAEKVGWLTGKIRDFANSILDGIKSTLDIHSPSKKSEELGKYFDEGFGIGIERNQKLATTPVERLSNSIFGVNSMNIERDINYNIKSDSLDLTSKIDRMTELLSNRNTQIILDRINNFRNWNFEF